MTATFAQLGVPTFICDALERRGITQPFEIQAATVADGLAARDVCGRAPTGSGKTIAFGVPLVAVASEHGRSKPGRPTALVLAPTRELAEQITGEIRSFSGRLRVDAVYGGVGYGAQLTALRRGVDILVACPGRLEDLIGRGDVDLSGVRHVVLDEADRMADMGFMPAVRRLLDQTRPDRQTMLFSATLDGDVARLTRDYQRDPVRHEIGEETPDIQAATHRFWKLDRLERNAAVVDVVNAAWPSVIFCRTRHGADRLAKQLGKLDVVAVPIHGGRSQSQRNRALDDFTEGRAHALVATDVAARGIHVDGVASVIHYDPPEDHKAYVHRSGRTARAGAEGLVVSLLQPSQVKQARQMQKKIGLDEPVTEPDIAEVPDGVRGARRVLAPAAAEPVREAQPRRKPPRRSGKKPAHAAEHRPDRAKDHRPKRRSGNYAPDPRRERADGHRVDRTHDSEASPDRGHRSTNAERRHEIEDRSQGRGRPAGGTARPSHDRQNRSGNGGKGRNAQSNAKKSRAGSKGSAGSNGRGRGGANQARRPNRKARRAHLQPGANRR